MKYNKEFAWHLYDTMSSWSKWGVKNPSCRVSFIKSVKHVSCRVTDMLTKILKKFTTILTRRNTLRALDCPR